MYTYLLYCIRLKRLVTGKRCNSIQKNKSDTVTTYNSILVYDFADNVCAAKIRVHGIQRLYVQYMCTVLLTGTISHECHCEKSKKVYRHT